MNKANTPKINVVIRKRPLNKKQILRSQKDIIQIPNSNIVLVKQDKVKVDLTPYTDEYRFIFDAAFDQNNTNQQIYIPIIRPLIYSAYDGARVSCFAYGQTGSGKTYTMLGDISQNVKGLYLLAAYDVFSLQSNKYNDIEIYISFYQIYCGKLFDLLNDRNILHPRQDAKNNVNIIGLSERKIISVEQIMQIIQFGINNRVTSQNSTNNDSSRSHAILQILLKKNKKIHGKISFIDLAGSQRAADHADQTDKQTRIDGAQINKSLLALKQCIRALDQNKSHLPFRGSKLTMVLKDSFTGYCKSVMIGNISPNSLSCQNTLNTLKYADRVKQLKKPNKIVNQGDYLNNLSKQLMLPRQLVSHYHVNKKQQDNQHQYNHNTKSNNLHNNNINNINNYNMNKKHNNYFQQNNNQIKNKNNADLSHYYSNNNNNNNNNNSNSNNNNNKYIEDNNNKLKPHYHNSNNNNINVNNNVNEIKRMILPNYNQYNNINNMNNMNNNNIRSSNYNNNISNSPLVNNNFINKNSNSSNNNINNNISHFNNNNSKYYHQNQQINYNFSNNNNLINNNNNNNNNSNLNNNNKSIIVNKSITNHTAQQIYQHLAQRHQQMMQKVLSSQQHLLQSHQNFINLSVQLTKGHITTMNQSDKIGSTLQKYLYNLQNNLQTQIQQIYKLKAQIENLKYSLDQAKKVENLYLNINNTNNNNNQSNYTNSNSNSNYTNSNKNNNYNNYTNDYEDSQISRKMEMELQQQEDQQDLLFDQ